MRISHRELDACTHDPRSWVRAKVKPGPGGPRLGYDGVLKLGLHRLHKGESLEQARMHIESLFQRSDRLRNAARILDVLDRLDYYNSWLNESGTIVADSRAGFVMGGFGFLELVGMIDRVDFTETGHRGVLLGESSPDWQQQLRMPLVQVALATTYGVPASELAVGVQQLDGSGLVVRTYSDDEIATARENLNMLGERVRRIHTRLSRGMS